MECKTCGVDFNPTRKWQKFCSTKCRMFWHNQRKAVIKMDEDISDEDKQTILEFLDRAEDDPTLWDKLADKLKEIE